MVEEAPKMQCPLCKLYTSRKHCKSPTCTWYACHKHTQFNAVYFVGSSSFVLRKEDW